MKPGELIYLYRGWVRAKPMRETLAAVGIAIGVALVFATIAANLSISSSANRIITSLAGTAQLQASSRDPNGAPERTLHLPGVSVSANALEAPITLSHGERVIATEIVGAGPGVVMLNPTIGNVAPSDGLMLPSNLAVALGVKRGQSVAIAARGRATVEVVQQILGSETVGALSESRIAFAPLGYAQRLLGLPGRVSTILVHADNLKVAEASLKRAVEPGMEVTNSATDTALLNEALKPQDQSTSLFALLGILVGVLLVVTTTMLSMADRREELAELRLLGYSPKQLVQIVLSQGFILGGASSLVGVAGGWVLAVTAFRANPAYLASAFPFGSGTVVSIPLAVGVWFAGTVLACLCVSVALAGHGPAARVDARTRRRSLAIAVGLLAGSLTMLTILPLLSALLLAGALFLAVPAWLSGATRLADRDVKWPMIAAGSIRSSQVRSIGLAATAAVGVFGAVIAQGTHADLLKGLERGYKQYVESADVWVSAPSDDLATSPFPERGLATKIQRVPGVRSVRPYYGGWIDMATHRVWLIARSSHRILPLGQVIQGDAITAEWRLREGGWVATSDQLARTLKAHIGGFVTVPTPTGPERYRLAATTTNLGWSSGVLFLPASDYVRYWPGAIPTALEIEGHPNLATIQRITGPGLSVQMSSDRARIADALPRQGLQRLSQIAWLLVIAATLAVALALCASMFQRRDEFASLGLQSFKPRQIQWILAWEAILVTGSGAVLGALAGMYGHFAADRYLHDTTGYPIVWSLGLPTVVLTLSAVAIVTALVLIVPGRSAARSPLRLALEGR